MPGWLRRRAPANWPDVYGTADELEPSLIKLAFAFEQAQPGAASAAASCQVPSHCRKANHGPGRRRITGRLRHATCALLPTPLAARAVSSASMQLVQGSSTLSRSSRTAAIRPVDDQHLIDSPVSGTPGRKARNACCSRVARRRRAMNFQHARVVRRRQPPADACQIHHGLSFWPAGPAALPGIWIGEDADLDPPRDWYWIAAAKEKMVWLVITARAAIVLATPSTVSFGGMRRQQSAQARSASPIVDAPSGRVEFHQGSGRVPPPGLSTGARQAR